MASPEAAPEQTADQRIDQFDGEQGLWWWRNRPTHDDHDRDPGDINSGGARWTGGWSSGGSAGPAGSGGTPRGGVPEPTSALLVLGAGAGYVALRRRRKQND